MFHFLSREFLQDIYMVLPWVLHALQLWPTSTWNTFEDLALGPELPIPIKEWKRYVDNIFSMIPKGKHYTMLNYLNSIDPHIKFTVEQPNMEGTILFLDTLPQPKGEEISVSVYRKPTHTDRYLELQLQSPYSS